MNIRLRRTSHVESTSTCTRVLYTPVSRAPGCEFSSTSTGVRAKSKFEAAKNYEFPQSAISRTTWDLSREPIIVVLVLVYAIPVTNLLYIVYAVLMGETLAPVFPTYAIVWGAILRIPNSLRSNLY
jgi:hypothetical protein